MSQKWIFTLCALCTDVSLLTTYKTQCRFIEHLLRLVYDNFFGIRIPGLDAFKTLLGQTEYVAERDSVHGGGAAYSEEEGDFTKIVAGMQLLHHFPMGVGDSGLALLQHEHGQLSLALLDYDVARSVEEGLHAAQHRREEVSPAAFEEWHRLDHVAERHRHHLRLEGRRQLPQHELLIAQSALGDSELKVVQHGGAQLGR
mmetsp:Transcript_12042/g.22834  ORF Transcript_12042/g.22834 Transcript_12042/m.22834 type:complete len:200 (-) Transcript_12042:1875-2474(-)